MVNIVFEGATGSGKTTIIKKIKEIFEKEYKVGYTNDIDESSPLFNLISDMFKKSVLVKMEKDFNTTRYETLIQAADYLYLREKLYYENNEINLFDRNYASIYSYQKVLLDESIKDSEQFINNVLKCMKSGEKGIDLMVFFRKNISKSISRSEKRDNREYNKKEKNILKKFNDELSDFIRYNNNEYKLLVIEEKDDEETTIFKIKEKIIEIVNDKKKKNKWYELYKVDVEEFKNPDEYIKYKLKNKLKFIKKIKKYSKNGKVIELGCGTGIVAGYLQKDGLEVTAFDENKKVLEFANEIARKSNIIVPCSKYEVGNIFNMSFKEKEFDVAYSNGVLEHYSDEEIIKTLGDQMKISKYVIFGIPSTYFDISEKMLGNERTLKKYEWENLIEKAGGEILEKTGFHYYNKIERLKKPNKWIKPKAFWLFIIKEKNKGEKI